MNLSDILDAILDQTTSNEITVTIKRDKTGYIEITVKDSLSEICNVREFFADEALGQAEYQLEQFVDGLSAGE